MKKGKSINKEVIKLKLKEIEKVYGLIKNWKLHTIGWDHYIIEIDKKYMFRFVRDKKDIPQFKRERNFLKEFIKISPISVPDYKYWGKDFGGYKKIIGKEFTKNIQNSLSKKQKIKVAKQISSFLKILHSFKPKRN